MKHLFWVFILIISLQSCQNGSYPQSSGSGNQYPSERNQTPSNKDNYPKTSTGRAADKNVSIGNIRITDKYTILYIAYRNNNSPQYDRNGRLINDGHEDIAFQSTAQLIAANGARVFKLIKTEGIPQLVAGQDVKAYGKKTIPGEQVNFVVYFERLDKGLEDFDLFECNDYDYITCWNVYGLKISNPIDVITQPKANPVPPVSPPSKTPNNGTTTVKTKPKSGKIGEVENKPIVTPIISSIQVSGVVRDIKTNRAVSATINYKLSSSKQIIDSVQSFSSTGIYKMTLQKGQVYTYTASAKGYLSVNDIVDLSNISSEQKVSKDIYLAPIVVGDKIALKNIYFEVSKSDLLPASFAELNKLVTMMQNNPEMEIRLEGHTDIIGDADANLELSQERVDACENYLVQKGVSTNRIQAVGYGATRPLVKKGTDEERKVNRRVEFVVLKL
jgi:OmpA-OmpF porin, OOP family